MPVPKPGGLVVKGIENVRQELGINAGAVVGDVQRNAHRRGAPGAQPNVPAAAAMSIAAATRFDGLLGIVHQVEHHLQKLGGIGHNRRQIRV